MIIVGERQVQVLGAVSMNVPLGTCSCKGMISLQEVYSLFFDLRYTSKIFFTKLVQDYVGTFGRLVFTRW